MLLDVQSPPLADDPGEPAAHICRVSLTRSSNFAGIFDRELAFERARCACHADALCVGGQGAIATVVCFVGVKTVSVSFKLLLAEATG